MRRFTPIRSWVLVLTASALFASANRRKAFARVLSFTLSSAFTKSPADALARFGTAIFFASLWSTRQMRA